MLPQGISHRSRFWRSGSVVPGKKKIYPVIGIGYVVPFVMEPPRGFLLDCKGEHLSRRHRLRPREFGTSDKNADTFGIFLGEEQIKKNKGWKKERKPNQGGVKKRITRNPILCFKCPSLVFGRHFENK
ncbi:hypothetical protein CEXT_627931 [Caerostris extrusa]|uniref:Uncharacterized protein n=1 Tax=Caerostris extrusa TaxID=172846 RepID=A0AAV4WFF9_CAEEX|nr:hypothetical protein CEXT_627931 [Caerostris extrusa]